jgi:glucan phosphorylase
MIQIDPICGMPVDTEKAQFKAEIRGGKYYFCNEEHKRSFLEGPRIAYFSMEIGLKNEMPTYSGGLGVLAGDTIRSSADLRHPLEYPEDWEPSRFLRQLPETANVRIEGRDVKIRSWIYDHRSPTGGLVPVVFLDTDLPENSRDDREITSFLYGGDDRYRLKQEMVLGIGGVRMLEALNFNVRKYHMNEGHSSLLTLELLKRNGMDAVRARDLCVFTTHTPVAAAFDKFYYEDVRRLLAGEFPPEEIKRYAGDEGPARLYCQEDWRSHGYRCLDFGFARRATAYKRATLMFSDIKRLKEINNRGRLQLIFAGKAHPRDDEGKRVIKEIYGYMAGLRGEIEAVYLENYDMEQAAKMVSGVDLWLNTPLPPMEASGTSGMKAACNGVIN